MKKLIAVFIFLVLLIPTFSRAAMNLDSLKQELANTPADSTGFQKYLRFFSRVGSDEKEAKLEVTRWLIIKSTEVEDYEVLTKTYHFLGHTMVGEQRYSEATIYFTTCLRIAEQHGLYHIMARVYNSYGLMYYGFNQIDKAIENYKLAISFSQKAENRKYMGTYYYNLAGMYFEQGKESEDTTKMAINVAKTAMDMQWADKDTFGIIVTKNGLAMMYISINELDSAEKELQESGELIRITRLYEHNITHYLRLGELSNARGEYQQAIDHLNEGMKYVKQYSSSRWAYSYYNFYSKAYEGIGNYKQAFYYKDLYQTAHDSIITAENYAIASEVLTRYETERKEKEILKLNKDNEIKQLLLQQEEASQATLKIILFSAFGVLVVLITLTVFLVRTNVDRKKANTELAYKNDEIQKQSHILNQQSKLISRYQSQMNPHFVFNALNTIQGLVIHDQKDKTMRQLQLLSKLMRDTLNNSEQDFVLLPQELDYLKRYLDFEQVKFTTPVEFKINLPEDEEALLIPPMMIQPFIENAVRHAALHLVKKPQITLDILTNNDVLTVRIADNGCGFDTSDKETLKSAHAVSIIRTRLAVIWEASGRIQPPELFSITSKPVQPEGTTIEFYLPLKYTY